MFPIPGSFSGRARAAGQMEDDEVEAQLGQVFLSGISSLADVFSHCSTFVIAGHETTATTLGWLLYELAAHPEDQNKIREEISQGRLQNGKLSSTEYDSMTFLNATIKVRGDDHWSLFNPALIPIIDRKFFVCTLSHPPSCVGQSKTSASRSLNQSSPRTGRS